MRDYIVLDIETTGISPQAEAITEIGAAKVVDDQVVEVYSMLINPGRPIPSKITELTGISDQMVAFKPSIDEVLPEFVLFCEDLPILGHNVIFDFGFLKTNAMRQGLSFEKNALDTLSLARQFLSGLPSYSLTSLIAHMRINRENAHRALDDAMATHELYQIIKKRYGTLEHERFFIPKPLAFKPAKTSPITDKQVKFLRSLIATHKVQVDYVIEDLSKSEASKKIDGIISEYGYRR